LLHYKGRIAIGKHEYTTSASLSFCSNGHLTKLIKPRIKQGAAKIVIKTIGTLGKA